MARQRRRNSSPVTIRFEGIAAHRIVSLAMDLLGTTAIKAQDFEQGRDWAEIVISLVDWRELRDKAQSWGYKVTVLRSNGVQIYCWDPKNAIEILEQRSKAMPEPTVLS